MKSTQFFGDANKRFSASSPGRLDVMGGIADYSGSLVLEMPIEQRTTVEVQLRDDGLFRVHSSVAAEMGWANPVTVAIEDSLALAKQKKKRWALYVIGCALILRQEKKVKCRGADFYVRSDIPPGKGVSASAALEVATMSALAKAYDLKLGDTELPILCQQAENKIVGAPCGLMDQLTCYLGRKNHLLPILCRPDLVQTPIPIPEGMRFEAIDSGVTHSVGGASYTDVRTAAFMGYAIIAHQEKKKRPFGGYLCNIPVSVFEEKYRDLLPEKMRGKAFLEKYGSTIDPATEVKKSTLYKVRACTRHPIYENHRVHLFSLLLQSQPLTRQTLTQMGELMFQSHASYSACGLGSAATDRIVAQVRRSGLKEGVFGAKITGGGSGGTVCRLHFEGKLH